MSDLFQQQSPLVQIDLAAAKGGAPLIEEKAFLGFLNLRCNPKSTKFLAGLLKVLECEPPRSANSVIDAGVNRIYWLGPNEWLVVTPTGQQLELKQRLEKALKGVFHSVVDNSSGMTLLQISGENAAALLATDCPFDLHPNAFKTGQCAQTRLAKAGMIVSPLNDNKGFELIIRRSFADYLLLWLQQAAVEFE